MWKTNQDDDKRKTKFVNLNMEANPFKALVGSDLLWALGLIFPSVLLKWAVLDWARSSMGLYSTCPDRLNLNFTFNF